MKLLFDHHLSHNLVRRRADVSPDSTQTGLLGMATADDAMIWEHARPEPGLSPVMSQNWKVP